MRHTSFGYSCFPQIALIFADFSALICEISGEILYQSVYKISYYLY